MAICCVSEKIQTAYVCLNTLRALNFFASLHLTIFEQAANFEFFNSPRTVKMSKAWNTSPYGPIVAQEPVTTHGGTRPTLANGTCEWT
jgi:hypothetical protein